MPVRRGSNDGPSRGPPIDPRGVHGSEQLGLFEGCDRRAACRRFDRPLAPMKSIRCQILAVLTAANCSGQIIVNGSFESPVLTANQNYFGAFSFAGWSGASTGGTGNAGLAVGTDFGLSPYDGNQAFSFNGNNPAPGTYIEQTFNTIAGQSYSVGFAVGRNGSAPSQFLELQGQVFNSSGSQLAILNATPPAGNSYSIYTFTFLADSATSRLRFTDISSSNPLTDVFIDGVSVAAVPEPPTWVLMAASLAALVWRFGPKFERGFWPNS
jgi:hypothetical protein